MIEVISGILVLLIALLNAQIDSSLIKKQRYLDAFDHGIRVIARVGIFIALLFWIDPYTWIQAGIAFVVLSAIFWVVFDIAMNVKLGFDNIYRIGETAATDRAMRWLGEKMEIILHRLHGKAMRLFGEKMEIIPHRLHGKQVKPEEQDIEYYAFAIKFIVLFGSIIAYIVYMDRILY